MKLYHGSDILIETIDLEKSKPYKDYFANEKAISKLTRICDSQQNK